MELSKIDNGFTDTQALVKSCILKHKYCLKTASETKSLCEKKEKPGQVVVYFMVIREINKKSSRLWVQQ